VALTYAQLQQASVRFSDWLEIYNRLVFCQSYCHYHYKKNTLYPAAWRHHQVVGNSGALWLIFYALYKYTYLLTYSLTYLKVHIQARMSTT